MVLLLAVTHVYVRCETEVNELPVGVSRRLLGSPDVKAVGDATNGSAARCDNATGTCAVSTAQPPDEDQPLWIEVSRQLVVRRIWKGHNERAS